MTVTPQADKTKNLTTFKVTGVLTYEEVRPAIKAFYEGDPTTYVLWDLLDATDIRLSSAQVEGIVNYGPRYDGKRTGGKTALVAQDDLAYGLSRMFELHNDIQAAPYPIRVFRHLEEAHRWFIES